MPPTPDELSAEPPPPSLLLARPRFRVTPVSLIIYAIAVGVTVVLNLGGNREPNAAFRYGQIAGAAVGLYLFPLLFSWLAWLIARRRQWVATGVFCVVAALSLVGQISKTQERVRASDAALAEAQAASRQAVEEEKKSVEAGNTTTGATARLDRLQTRFTHAGEAAGGEDQKMIQVIQTVMARIKTPMQVYETASGQFEAAGGLKPDTLTSAAIIADRRRLIAACIDANSGLTKVSGDSEPMLRAELKRGGFPAATIESFIGGYRRSAHFDLQLKIREADGQLLEAGSGMLEVLGQTWGGWRIKPATGLLAFDNHEDAERYNGFFHALKTARATEQEAQKQLVAAQSAEVAPTRGP